MKNKILYIGNFEFPDRNAAGKRVYANGKILCELGYEVIYVGLSKKTKYSNLIDTKDEFDGFINYHFTYPKITLGWLNYFDKYKQLTDLIYNQIGINDIKCVIYYGSPSISIFLKKLIKFSKKNDIIIISDCVDWLNVKSNNPFFDFVKWVDNSYQKIILNTKVDGLIVISNYLKRYYLNRGKSTVIIPPLAVDKPNKILYYPGKIKKMMYAGVPFRKGIQIKDFSGLKDRIDITVKLLADIKDRGYNFIFNVYGFTEDEFLIAFPNYKEYIDKLNQSIIFNGQISNRNIINEIMNSDFTILIREVNKGNTAGFPTKVSESINYGTPVITTKTSDIESYIKDNVTGFFLDINNYEISLEKLIKIISLDNTEIIKLKNNCQNSDIFYYKNYIKKMNNFISILGNK